jgi:hypothetical protein
MLLILLLLLLLTRPVVLLQNLVLVLIVLHTVVIVISPSPPPVSLGLSPFSHHRSVKKTCGYFLDLLTYVPFTRQYRTPGLSLLSWCGCSQSVPHLVVFPERKQKDLLDCNLEESLNMSGRVVECVLDTGRNTIVFILKGKK